MVLADRLPYPDECQLAQIQQRSFPGLVCGTKYDLVSTCWQLYPADLFFSVSEPGS